MDQEGKTKSPYDQSLDDARIAATGKEDVANTTGGFYRGNRGSASAELSKLEDNATNTNNLNSEKSADSLEKSASTAENIINNVADKAAPAPAKAALKAKGKLKKYGPIGFFFGLVLTVFAFFFTSQGLFGVGLIDRFIDEFNTIGTTNQVRSQSIIRHLIRRGNIPKGFKSELNSQGVKVSSKNGILYLHFKDSSGNKVRVAATSDGAKESKIGRNAITIDDALAKYPEFNTKMYSATRKFGGQSSSWYNRYASEFMKFYGINRDRFHKWDITENSSEEDAETKLRQEIADGREKINNTAEGVKRTETEDEDGKHSTIESDGNTTIDSSNEEKLRGQLGDIAKNAGSKVNSAGSVAATIVSGGVCINYYTQLGIQNIVNAEMIAQWKNIFSVVSEAVQKTQTGAGKNSPMNTVLNILSRTNSDGTSAMSSPGISTLFGGGKGDQYNNHEAVKKSSLEGLSSRGGSTVKEYKQCNASRLAAAPINLIDTITDYAPAVGIAKKLGKIVFGVVATQAIGFVINSIVQAQIDSAVESITADMSGDDLTTELGGQFLFNGGESEISDRHKYSGGNAFTSETLGTYQQAHEEVLAKQAEYERTIFSPFDTRSQYTFFGSLVRSAAAFSTTSSFSGAISQVGSIVSNSFQHLLPSVSAKSLTSLNQTIGFCPAAESAGAFGDNDTAGAAADMSCIPYIGDVSTTSDRTADISQEDLFNYLCNLDGGQLNECGSSNVDVYKPLTIKKGSKLAQYAAFWNKREVNLGAVDANTAAARGNGVINTVADTGIDGLSDIADAISALSENTDENICWSTGGIGVYGSPCQRQYLPEMDYFQAYYGWEEYKQNAEVSSSSDFVAADDLDSDEEGDETGYEVTADPAQEYLDSRIIAYNPDEDLSDVAVINEYTGEEYDMSYEGTLARRTGMTKEQVIALLDTIDYYAELANYNPTNLAPLNSQKEDAPALAGAPEEQVVATVAHTIARLAQAPPRRPAMLDRRGEWSATSA